MIFRKSFVNSFLRNGVVVISLTVFVALTLVYFNGQRRIARQSQAYLDEYTEFEKAAIKDEVRIVLSRIDAKIEQTRGLDSAVVEGAKQDVLSWVNRIRLRENQYIVVNTMDGTILAHYKTGNIGRNMWHFEDPNGVKAVQEATRVSRAEQGGFVSYVGSIRPTTGQPGRKITYAKSVPEWGWVVSTGIYLDDIELAAARKKNDLTENLKTDFFTIFLVLMAALALFLIGIKFFADRLKTDFAALNSFFKDAATQAVEIRPAQLYFSEFQELALPVNQMIGRIKASNEELQQHQEHLEDVVRKQTTELKDKIDAQNQIEEELKAREATLQSIFKAAPVGIGMVRQRVLVQVNSRICEMLGHEPHALLGQSARMLYPSDADYEYVGREKYKQISAKGTGTVETRWRCKDGRVVDVLLSSTPLNVDNWDEGVTFTALDITERKRSERLLKENEAKFRNIFENLMDVYFETGLDGTIKTTSPSAEDFSGYTVSELIGNPVDILYANPKDRERLLEELAKQGKVRGFELVFQHKSGELYDVSVNADIVCDEKNRPVGLSGTIRDVTQEKELEKRLQRSKKMESLGLMAGGIAHDLNNILSGIVSYPDLLLMDIPEDSPLRRPVEVIRDSGRRAADVVSDLLTIAKGVAATKDVLDVNTIVAEYFDSGEYRQLCRSNPGVVFERQLDAGLLTARCSSPHMKKVIMNLVANAAEAIETKGRVVVTTANRYLDTPLKGYEDIAVGEYVLLSVADNGAGISGEEIERIFEPFYTKKVMGRSGTGLGLAVVWNTVQDHNGYIDVRSGPGGTVFDLYFPVTREAPPVEAAQILPEAYMGSGETILVVDDEDSQREIACGILSKLNYTAVSVASGEEAITYLKTRPVDLLVLDMIMTPGISGRETFERVRAFNPRQKAIIASGFAETEDVKAVQKSGAGRFVKKPYTLEKIGLAIKGELRG